VIRKHKADLNYQKNVEGFDEFVTYVIDLADFLVLKSDFNTKVCFNMFPELRENILKATNFVKIVKE
jgi:hypothetical protein